MYGRLCGDREALPVTCLPGWAATDTAGTARQHRLQLGKNGLSALSPAPWPPKTRKLSCCRSQFLLRQQVLALYRRILRGVRQIPDPTDQRYMKEWARGEFRRNQRATDEITIRMMITQGQQQVQELESALKLARS